MESGTGSASATIEYFRPGVAVVRFRPKLKLNASIITEVMRMRRENVLGSCAAIVLIPEHTDYDMDLLAVDHYVANGLAHRTEALAIVCQELGLIPVLRLYFAYHPPPFPFIFCRSLEEAKSWMRQQAGLIAVV